MKTVVTLVVVGLLAPAAFAHDTWIMCTPPNVRSGADVTLHITSGMAFPDFDTAPEPSRIQRCEWRIGGERGSLSSFEKKDKDLVVSGRVHPDGVAVVYAEFKPRDIDLDPDEVDEYMDEIGAPESVRLAWKNAGPDAAFHETYTKHAKTYLRVGGDGDTTGCLGPVGFNIDFLLDRDPTSLEVGDTLPVKVMRGGQEMESFAVGTVGGNGAANLQRTSKSGIVVVEIDSPGWWLVRATELRRNTDGTWESDFTTLTFFVED